MSEIALTDRESRRLKSLEKSIAEAGGTMYESLRAIHDERLYRDKFDTWEAYCDERWRMSKSWAYRIIQHGRILALLNENGADAVSPMGDVSERATRELNGLPDATKVEVVKQVVAESAPAKGGGKKVTAKAVRAKVGELNGKPSHPKAVKSVSAIKELESAVGAVSRALEKAGAAHGKGEQYTAIFAALTGIKKSIAEWKA